MGNRVLRQCINAVFSGILLLMPIAALAADMVTAADGTVYGVQETKPTLLKPGETRRVGETCTEEKSSWWTLTTNCTWQETVKVSEEGVISLQAGGSESSVKPRIDRVVALVGMVSMSLVLVVRHDYAVFFAFIAVASSFFTGVFLPASPAPPAPLAFVAILAILPALSVMFTIPSKPRMIKSMMVGLYLLIMASVLMLS